MYAKIVIFILLPTAVITCMAACSEESNVKSIKTKNIQDENHLLICPFCREKSLLQDFKDADEPNMKLCPKCGKRIPMPFLLRQTALKKR